MADPKGTPQKTPKALARDLLGTDDERDAFRVAKMHPQFINANSFKDQVGILCQYLRNDLIHVSYERIAQLFPHTSKQSIQNQHKKFLRVPQNVGRPEKLTEQDMAEISSEITRLHSHQPYPIYPTFLEIFDFVRIKLKKIVKLDTLRKKIHKKLADKIKTCTGISMDISRLNASLCELEQNLEELKNKINGLPIPFVFNLDEFGQQDYADAREKTVLVPANYLRSTAQCPVSRTGKRASCLACISPCGLFAKPQITVTRTTVDAEIYKKIPKDSVQIVNTASGYINTNSFKHWLTTEFIPNLRELRLKYGYFGPSVIIMDGYLARHCTFDDIN